MRIGIKTVFVQAYVSFVVLFPFVHVTSTGLMIDTVKHLLLII